MNNNKGSHLIIIVHDIKPNKTNINVYDHTLEMLKVVQIYWLIDGTVDCCYVCRRLTQLVIGFVGH